MARDAGAHARVQNVRSDGGLVVLGSRRAPYSSAAARQLVRQLRSTNNISCALLFKAVVAFPTLLTTG